MYRVTYTPYENEPHHTFDLWFETLKEARERAKNYVGYRAKAHAKPYTLTRHHAATQKGYWPVDRHLETGYYCGRFGEGMIVHHASMRTPLGMGYSRKYHVVEYYTIQP